MEDSAFEVGDALSQINQIKYNDLDSALEGTKRSIEGVFLPTVAGLSSGITDALSTLGNSINEAEGDFSKISDAIGALIESGKAAEISNKWFGTDIVILEDYD